jgi:hypothetical protein
MPPAGWRRDLPEAGAGPGGTPGVLIIEEEPAVRAALERFLRRGGFATWTAGSRREALTVYQHNSDRITLVMEKLRMEVVNDHPYFREKLGGPPSGPYYRRPNLVSRILRWLRWRWGASWVLMGRTWVGS